MSNAPASLVERQPPAPSLDGPAGRAHTWLLVETVGWILIGLTILLWLQPATNVVEISDSQAHVVLFVGTAMTSTALLIRRQAWLIVVSLFGLAAFAAITELMQTLITNDRVAELGDVQADLVGITLGAVVTLGLRFVLGHNRAQQVVAVISAVALLVLGSTMIFTSATVQRWWNCRDHPALPATPEIAGHQPLLFSATPWSVDTEVGAPAPVSQPAVGTAWCGVMAKSQFTVTAWVRSSTNQQFGPTRIVSSSSGTESDDVNFHLGQEFDAASIRVRTGGEIRMDWETIDGVFEPGTWQHLAVTYDSGDTRLLVDGVEIAQFDTIHGWIAGWDLDFPLLIGDEATRDRTFVGDIEGVAVFDQSFDASTVTQVMQETRQP